MGYQTSDNLFSPTKFIVDAVAQEGVFTTIQAAINAATYGTDIFIRPGTYVENITLKDGVNLTAFTRDVNIVQINGTITMNTAGTVNISGITVQTNGATAVSFSSANIQSLRFFNCNLTSTNADLITNSNSSASSGLVFENCTMTAAATYKIFVATMTGVITCINCGLGGASTTAWTSTAGNIVFRFCTISQVFSISSTATVQIYNCIIGTNNLLFGTLATGTNCIAFNSRISTGTASIFSITSTGSVTVENCILQSSNASTVTGTGSFFDASNTYEATRNPATTTVVLNNNSLCNGNGTAGQVITSNGANLLPTWQNTGATSFQVVTQTFTGNGTYTPTAGMKFCIVEVVGAGGGGGGTAATTGTNVAGAGGGAGGGYARKTFSSATIGASQTVTIGTAGTAGAAGNNNGGTGGTTTFGALLQATGGGGGVGSGAASGAAALGGSAGIGSLGDVNSSGQAGFNAWGYGIAGFGQVTSGNGGTSCLGGGARSVSAGFSGSVAGIAGTGYGGGGSGAVGAGTSTAAAGGAGAAGFCIVTEYVLVSATIVTTLPWTEVTAATQALAVNNGYVTNRVAGVTYTLPASGAVGDVIRISGKSGISTVNQNANQQIVLASASTTVGITGSIASTNTGDCIELICTTGGTSTVWRANGQIGVWSVT